MAPAVAASLGTHLAFAIALFLVAGYGPERRSVTTALQSTPDAEVVWLPRAGPGGGGGGGGNRTKEPPRSAQLRGGDTITIAAQKPQTPESSQQVRSEPNAVQRLDIPVKPLAAGIDSFPGLIAVLGPQTRSQGPGSGGGAGTGDGPGVGRGRGNGLDDGEGGNGGGGPNGSGSGVTMPQVIKQVKPAYTTDAMRAKVQGIVLVECLVNADGSVGDVRVRRSLDSAFGLDQEAVKAARQWRFRPGTRLGEPVPVLVTIELTFTLR
jgi:periplasmic protein TonB